MKVIDADKHVNSATNHFLMLSPVNKQEYKQMENHHAYSAAKSTAENVGNFTEQIDKVPQI